MNESTEVLQPTKDRGSSCWLDDTKNAQLIVPTESLHRRGCTRNAGQERLTRSVMKTCCSAVTVAKQQINVIEEHQHVLPQQKLSKPTSQSEANPNFLN
jgi:hypothetical protein